MSLPTWKTECGCTQVVAMGQKRDRVCEHGRVFVKEGAKPRPLNSLSNNTKISEASEAQRQKVEGLVCVGCGKEVAEDGSVVIDPAHVWPRGKGGCDHEDCVIPLCRLPFEGGRGCHRLFDEGQLDLLGRLEERDFHAAYARELAHPIAEHGVSLVTLVRRLSGSDWKFVQVPPASGRRRADLKAVPNAS